MQWPEVGYVGRERVWPVFVRGHQTSLGTLWGIAVGPLLGGGIGGVRRSSVLMGLGLLMLVWGLGRRVGLSRGWATVAALACAASPGLWFFCRTGYAYELASRVLMLAALFLAAPRVPPGWPRAVAVGAAFALALLCRATIATTLAPALLLVLFHPRRWAGLLRLGGLLAVGGGAPIALAVLALVALPFAAGTAPASGVQLDGLAGRTLVAPAVALVQLAWTIDPRIVLSRIVDGDLHVTIGWVRPLLAGVVAAAALWRWWGARAGEAERLFVGGLVGNSLCGAWLYGDPMQFQLGMALEPLFVLALAQQLAALSAERVRVGVAAAAALLGLRVLTLGSLWASEQRTDNPMLSGRAQRSLVALLQIEGIRGDDLITTAYDHVGVLEVLTGEALRPIHAWRPLRAAGVPEAELVAQWNRVLDARPACHVLLTRAPSLVAGPFTDHRAVAAALERAVSRARGAHRAPSGPGRRRRRGGVRARGSGPLRARSRWGRPPYPRPSRRGEAAVNEAEPGRRSLLAMLAAFAALTLLVVGVSLVARARKASFSAAPVDSFAPEVTAFLGPLATGTRFDGWRIARVPPSSPDQMTLELESDGGERFVVDVHARSPGAPPGLAETARLAIYLRSETRGAQTPEAAVRATIALAAALRAREDSGHPLPPLQGLPPPAN